MTVKEYNQDFLPKIDRAFGFVSNLDSSMYKTDDRENVMHQLNCIGWSDECKETIKTALEMYQKSALNDIKIEGKVTEADFAHNRYTYVRPIAHHYENEGELPYIKYGCPVCESLGNKHQLTHGEDKCPLCNVNLIWKK